MPGDSTLFQKKKLRSSWTFAVYVILKVQHMLAFWSLNTVMTHILGSGNKLSRMSDDLIKMYSNVHTTSDKFNALVIHICHRLGVCDQCPIHHRQLPHHPVIQSQVCVTVRPRYGLELQALFSWLCDKCYFKHNEYA